ncbi:MAG TPA: diacylglycerol kinase family protein [Chitinophagales bacterium]|nr:diacylglycerol kinase family protein [Chitinophagales bacterium]
MKIAFIINGTSKYLSQVQERVHSACKDLDYTIYISERKGHIEELTQDAISSNCNRIIVCGGDGSLNEAVNGLIQTFSIQSNEKGSHSYDWEGISKIKLGVFPIGSGNDFSKTVKVKNDIHQLKQLIVNDHSQMIDVGWATYHDFSGQLAARFFINITDVGMGGEVVAKLDNKITKSLGPSFNYLWAITSTAATYQKVKIRATANDFSWEGDIMNFVVANGKCFGKGLCIAPDASVSDGLFDIVILGDFSMLDFAKHIGKIKKGQKVNHPKIEYHRLKEVYIESLENKQLAIDMDGDYIGHVPLKLTNLEGKINFICK